MQAVCTAHSSFIRTITVGSGIAPDLPLRAGGLYRRCGITPPLKNAIELMLV